MLAAIALAGDQLPMPGKQCFRRDDCGNFAENASAKLFGPGSQAPSLVAV
jgi:hypothetical protein